LSGGSGDRSDPAEQEEVVSAQLATEGQKEPVDRSFKTIPGAYAAKLDGSAIRAVAGEHA
jgi:hypothetical protein